MNGAQVVVEALKREGVKYIFGYPGVVHVCQFLMLC